MTVTTKYPEPVKIVLIGASVRPLIASCLRANCVPVAFDFFADWDGQQMILASGHQNASLTKIDCYEDLLDLDFAKLGNVAVLAGGAELRSDLVSAVGEQIPLLGASAKTLAAIGDSLQWLQVLRESGCRVPEVQLKMPANWSTGDWLVKLPGSCGGSGVQKLDRSFQDFDIEGTVGEFYFQKQISGQSWSAVMVSRRQSERGSSETFLLGCTRQWLAADFAEGTKSKQHTQPFAYRGSIGPLEVSESVQLQVERVVGLLGQKFAMQGIWGIDFVLDAEERVWPVDFNPRITASAELFESTIVRSESKFRSVLDLHLAACLSTRANDAREFEKLAGDRRLFSEVESCEAKRIVFHFGSKPIKVDKAIWERLSHYYDSSFFQASQTGSTIADVPRIGDLIDTGRPLLTIRSRAKTEVAAVALLDELFDAVQTCVVATH